MLPFSLRYNGLPGELMPYVESLEYTDTSGKDPSTLTVVLCNADGRFTASWSCTAGDALSVSFGAARPDPLAISEITVNAVPKTVTLRATSRPATTKSPSGRGGGVRPPSSGALVTDKRSWDSADSLSLKAVAGRVCEECGPPLRSLSKANPTIAHVARYNETGYHLLERYCRRYALTVRATASEVQIVSAPASKSAPAQASVAIPVRLIESLGNTDGLKPAKVQSVRRSHRTGRVLRGDAGDGDGEIVSLSYSAESAEALYTEAVRSALVGELDVYPVSGVMAGTLVQIDGFGLREVVTMRYAVSGNSERMTLVTRGV